MSFPEISSDKQMSEFSRVEEILKSDLVGAVVEGSSRTFAIKRATMVPIAISGN
jgi:hypothetical protein